MTPALRKAIKTELVSVATKYRHERNINVSKERLKDIFDNEFTDGPSLDHFLLDLDTFVDNRLQSELDEEEWPE